MFVKDFFKCQSQAYNWIFPSAYNFQNLAKTMLSLLFDLAWINHMKMGLDRSIGMIYAHDQNYTSPAQDLCLMIQTWVIGKKLHFSHNDDRKWN